MAGKIPSGFDIQSLKGVGPHKAKLLSRLGIKTLGQALYYLPYRYENRISIKKICDIALNERTTVSGEIISSQVLRLPGRKLKIFEITVSDGSASLKAKWFNQPFLHKTLRRGSRLFLYGTVGINPYRRAGFEMENPEYEIVGDSDDSLVHINRIVPVYRVTSGISVRQMRSMIFSALNACSEDLADPVPDEVLKRNALPGLSESLAGVHFPDAGADIERLNRGDTGYHRRLCFDELFMLELGLVVLKKKNVREKGISFDVKGSLLEKLRANLPFKLTAAQERVFDDILADMKKPHPMSRLIQGDVGCGKTIIALMAMTVAAECGYQSALMAPTEILAEQHYVNIRRSAEDLGLRVCLLTGSKKDRPLGDISSGEMDLVIGTHALIQEGVIFHKLGLAVIDEQHRFGVSQRALLREKGLNPDVLIMTATPIPRTLALTLYGDLDCSVIDELPPNRHPVTTRLFLSSQKDSIYNLIGDQINAGRQVYIVYPVIEESEKTDLRPATTGKLAFEKIFPDFRVDLIHGRMKTQERERIMESFKRGEIEILVSTTVIEVGVDVPNATLMIIIHAERFGLSQLHQLRGRIGRGPHHSCCALVTYGPHSEEAKRRLDIMTESADGFRIAEEDLKLRGPGEFFGTRQSGMPDLRVADILRDASLLNKARAEAFRIVDHDPELAGCPVLREAIEEFWRGKIEFFKTC